MQACRKLGTEVYNAVIRSKPIRLNGETAKTADNLFSLQNPYLLEALPENSLNYLMPLQDKPLDKVCKFLDNFNENELPSAIKKYLGLFGKQKNNGFSSHEIDVLYKKAFPNIKVPAGANEDAFVYLNMLSKETGSKFDAHGIAKVSVTDQLKQLNNLLTNGIDKNRAFCTAPLVSPKTGLGAGLGTGGGHAYREGSFIVVSGKGQKITDTGIKHVIVNDAYYNIIDDLAKKFPQVNFVRADKAAEYFGKTTI